MMVEKFIKLGVLAFVGIIVGSFAIGLVSGAGVGGQFGLNGALPGFNNNPQANHNGMYMNPQDPNIQHMQQNPYMNMQGQMPYMNMQGQMPYMNMQGQMPGMNMQGQMPGMNMQDNNMQNMNMPDKNMKGMGMMDMDMMGMKMGMM